MNRNKLIIVGIVLLAIAVFTGGVFVYKNIQAKEEVAMINNFCNNIDFENVAKIYNENNRNKDEDVWKNIDYPKFKYVQCMVVKKDKVESSLMDVCRQSRLNSKKSYNEVAFSVNDDYTVIGRVLRDTSIAMATMGDSFDSLILKNKTNEIVGIYNIGLGGRSKYKRVTQNDIKKVMKLIIKDKDLFNPN